MPKSFMDLHQLTEATAFTLMFTTFTSVFANFLFSYMFRQRSALYLHCVFMCFNDSEIIVGF